MNPLEMVLDFVFNNIVYIVILGVIGFFLYSFLRITKKEKLKPLNRSEFERMKFVERMKHNKSYIYKWFKRGNHTLGKITAYRVFKTNPKEREMTQIVVRPLLIDFKKIQISNPFAKLQAFQLVTDKVDYDKGNRTISVPEWVTFDYYFGIYYDMVEEREHTKLIKRDNVIRTDLNGLASIYLVKAQEQSTFDPNFAHEMTKLEKQLQIEMAKRKGKAEAI